MRVAFKVQHRVHHMLQHTRARQGAFLGDMTDQHDADTAGLGRARQVRRAFAHLRHRTGGRRELIRIDCLDRVDDGDVRLGGRQNGQDFFQLDLGQHPHLRVVQPEAARA